MTDGPLHAKIVSGASGVGTITNRAVNKTVIMKAILIIGGVALLIGFCFYKYFISASQPSAAPCAHRLMVIAGAKEQYKLQYSNRENRSIRWEDIAPFLPD